MEANLLVTYDPAHRGKAQHAVDALLKGVGEQAQMLDSDVEGIFLLRVGDARKAVKALREACMQSPQDFAFTFHWVPIDEWVGSDDASLKKAMAALDKKIDPDETWRLDFAKRQYDRHGTGDLIKLLTEPIDKPKVDLKNAKQIVSVQIVGSKAGVALLGQGELLNVAKARG